MSANRFYVHIIESPSPTDLLAGRTEGNTLCEFLKLAGIPCQYNLAQNEDEFVTATTERVGEGCDEFNAIPILHVSAHGNQIGIRLTQQYETSAFMRWTELANHIRPIHSAVEGLGVCMSSCYGLHGREMAKLESHSEVPMRWLVGCDAALSYADAALAFLVFYRRYQAGDCEDSILAAVRAASGISDFKCVHGAILQQTHLQEMMHSEIRRIAQYRTQAGE